MSRSIFGNVTRQDRPTRSGRKCGHFLPWDRFAASICDDLPHLLARRDDLPAAGPDLHLDYGLFLLAGILTDHGRTLTDYGLPAHQHAWARTGNSLLAVDLRYEPTEELRLWDEMYAQLSFAIW